MKTDRFYYGYVIVVLAFIIMSIQWAVIHSFGVFLKPLLLEFGWTRAATSGAFSLSSMIGGIVSICMGWLNDRMGPRVVMSTCGLFLGIGCILIAHTQNIWHFYLSFGVVIGVAMGGQFTPLMSTVARWFTARRGAMSGIVAAGVGVGALIGPQIANWIVSLYGWRWAYISIGAASMVIIIAASQFLKQKPIQKTPSGNDLTRKGATFDSSPDDGMAFMGVMCQRQYWLFMLTGFCYGYVIFSLTVHVVAHAIDKGLSATLAAGTLSVFGVLSIIGKILFGRVCDKIGSRRTTILGFVMMTLSFFLLIMSGGAFNIYTSAGIFGFFYGACTVSQSPMTAVLFGLRSHGLLLGIFGLFVTFGGALGPYMTGLFFDWTDSYEFAFIVCAAVSLLGVLSAFNINIPQHPATLTARVQLTD